MLGILAGRHYMHSFIRMIKPTLTKTNSQTGYRGETRSYVHSQCISISTSPAMGGATQVRVGTPNSQVKGSTETMQTGFLTRAIQVTSRLALLEAMGGISVQYQHRTGFRKTASGGVITPTNDDQDDDLSLIGQLDGLNVFK